MNLKTVFSVFLYGTIALGAAAPDLSQFEKAKAIYDSATIPSSLSVLGADSVWSGTAYLPDGTSTAYEIDVFSFTNAQNVTGIYLSDEYPQPGVALDTIMAGARDQIAEANGSWFKVGTAAPGENAFVSRNYTYLYDKDAKTYMWATGRFIRQITLPDGSLELVVKEVCENKAGCSATSKDQSVDYYAIFLNRQTVDYPAPADSSGDGDTSPHYDYPYPQPQEIMPHPGYNPYTHKPCPYFNGHPTSCG